MHVRVLAPMKISETTTKKITVYSNLAVLEFFKKKLKIFKNGAITKQSAVSNFNNKTQNTLMNTEKNNLGYLVT